MNTSIIQLICSIIIFCCFLFMLYLYLQVKKQYFMTRAELDGYKKKIFQELNKNRVETDTILIRYNKEMPFSGTELQHLSFDYVKESMATELAKELIEKNIFQIENYRHWYEGKITFVKTGDRI